MGCCLSREEDRFNSGNEALLPKGRNSHKQVDKAVDGNLAKNEGANGSYRSPSAVVAAGDATSNVSVKPQLPRKVVENVDLLGLDDKPPTPAASPAITNPTVPQPTLNVEPAPSPSEQSPPKPATKEPPPSKPATKEPPPSKPTELSLPKRAKSSSPKETRTSTKSSPKKPLETDNEDLMVPAFTSVSGVGNDSNGDGDGNGGDNGGGDNGGKAMDESKEPKPKKNIPTKKSKKKRKKGKK